MTWRVESEIYDDGDERLVELRLHPPGHMVQPCVTLQIDPQLGDDDVAELRTDLSAVIRSCIQAELEDCHVALERYVTDVLLGSRPRWRAVTAPSRDRRIAIVDDGRTR